MKTIFYKTGNHGNVIQYFGHVEIYIAFAQNIRCVTMCNYLQNNKLKMDKASLLNASIFKYHQHPLIASSYKT